MKFIYPYLFFLFFIFNANASTNFEKISKDFKLIYNDWNNGNFDKYEDIFRRDNENIFSTCVAVQCGAGALDHYNRVLSSLQNATGEKKGLFGKKFTYDEYQNYKNIYFEQKQSSAEAIKNTRSFLNKYNISFSKLKNYCKKSLIDIDDDNLANIKNKKDKKCNDLVSQTEQNLRISHLELSNFSTLLNYSLNENHNNSLKKSSRLLISYNNKILSIIDQGLVNLETEIKSIVVLENNLLRKKKIEKNSSLFNIKFFSLKKNYEDIITDKDKFDPTVDFFYEKFEKLKVSVFRYEFEPKKRNDVFEKYYFFTYKIIDKNDNPEPIVRIIASSKKIYNDIDSCYADANRITVQYKDQKEINDLFIVSDLNNNEYRVRISSTCFESFFSSKFHFNLVVGIYERNVENNNYYALLNLMGYKFKDINTLKKKDIKF
jgi:hypothetical protein